MPAALPALYRPRRSLPGPRAALLLAAGLLTAALAQAQFAMVPSPLPAQAAPSQAETDNDYRTDAAKHLYAAYPMRVYKGKMPPLLYGVAIVETDVDAQGQVLDVRLRRPPAAPEVGPWVVAMIKRAAPFPPPVKAGKATYMDIWLVHKGGNFQLDTLTEGQN
jgi:periplasmic protein TonB